MAAGVERPAGRGGETGEQGRPGYLECTVVVQVRALAWRPDGKLLAAGDSAGTITIRHIGRVTNASSAAVTVIKLVRKH